MPALLRCNCTLILLLVMGIVPAAQGQTTRPVDDMIFLDSGPLRVGVLRSSGGAIAHVSAGRGARNLANHFDRGRLIQQSYYGDADGSLWAKRPWRWNPVQGGDWRGTGATLLELKQESPTTLYARTLPRHWAAGTDLTDVVMEEWVTLDGAVAHVRYRMAYGGTKSHAEASQEIPACFFEPDLETLVLYDGARPWTGDAPSRSKPAWPNEGRRVTENWAAYVGGDGVGIGAYVPVADTLTCYRYGHGRNDKSACSYFAPLTRFAIKPGFTFEYDLYLTVGTVEEIRARFERVHRDRATGR